MMKDEIVTRLLELAIAIQQIPAPTFFEGLRADFVRARFLAEGLQDVTLDEAGNVLARLPGRGRDLPPLVVSAHLDTVFSHETELRIARDPSSSLRAGSKRIHGPGIGDNSIGVAALFGLLWSLRERGETLPGDIWFAANTGEEGLGDLRGMKAILERFGARVTAYLVLEGMAFQHVYHRAVAVQRYRITATTAGGHAWSDYGQPSAVHELAALTAQIASLALPVSPRTTLNVGKVAGGTSINTIAAQASLELDLRSESQQVLADLVAHVNSLIETANRPGVRVEAESIGQRPGGSIPADHPLVQLALSCIRAQGGDPVLIGGSTDANAPLSRGLPAVVMGVTTGGGAHTLNEFIDVEPVARGMAGLVAFVSGVWTAKE
jgi:acetylornithine deacetylase/succinyl-diaminopimelate desuccinylase-like protein